MNPASNQQQGGTTSQTSTAPQQSTTASQGNTGSPNPSILGDLLKTLGVGQNHIDDVHKATQTGNVNQQIDQAHAYVTQAFQHARDYAQQNPGAVLGGISALVIAAGMMRNNLGGRR